MSMPMEWDEPDTEVVPLDLTMKRKEYYAVSEVESEVDIDGPWKSTEDTPLPQSSTHNDVQSTPLDLSARRALSLQPPPPPSPTSANVAQGATMVVLSQKVQVESSPLSKPQPQYRDFRTPASPSPMVATEHLAQLHWMCSDAAAYRHEVLSSASVTEYNTSSPVLPTSSANHFHQNNSIQQTLLHLYTQQQQLQHNFELQKQLQFQLQQLCDGQQKLQLQASYGGVTLNPTSPPSSSVSNHFPSPTADDHHQKQQHQQNLDPEHHPHIEACATDDADVVDPEEVAAIYRQSEFLSLRQRYMESLRPPRNSDKMRRSSKNNNGNRGLTAGQQQNDQTYVMKRKRNNEAARRSWSAKRQKYFENQVRVMYLKKKVSEFKDIKRRLLKDYGDIFAE